MAKKTFPKPTLWHPKHPEKYAGDPNTIVSRSSWETKFMRWADSNPNVIHWASEEIAIPYISPIDGKPHRYFVDFLIKVKTQSGAIKKFAIEVKPHSQTLPPKGTRKTKQLISEHATFAVNTAKWKAAREHFSRRGIDFVILTEYELGLAKHGNRKSQ